MRPIYNFLLLFFFYFNAVYAGSFTASAPSKIGLEDEGFIVSYNIENEEAEKFSGPKFADFQVLSGPNKSTETQISSVNGQGTVKQIIKLSYTLKPLKTGSFVIPKAMITTKNGETIYSQNLKIEVVEGRTIPQRRPRGFGGFPGFPDMSSFFPDAFEDDFFQSRRAPQRQIQFSENDAFLKVELNKSSIYEGEPVVASIMLYTIYGFEGRIQTEPSSSDFIMERVNADPEKEGKLTEVNGKKYQVCPLMRYVLIPTKSGNLSVGSSTFTCVFQLPDGRTIKKSLSSSPLNVKAKSLPNRPSDMDYIGAVGNYKISEGLTPNDGFKAGEAMTYRLKISGSGNLKMMNAPNLVFPDSFEVYPSNPINNVKYSANGCTGDKVFDYVLIPRMGGEYTIPSFKFSYFDPASQSYKNLTTQPHTISVASAPNGQKINSIVATPNDKLINSDINYIKTSDYKLKIKKDFFVGSFLFWCLILIPLLALIICAFGFKQYVNYNADADKVKMRKANKVAVARLKQAKAYMDEAKDALFYEEIGKSLWGYVGDKLQIPLVNTNKEYVAEKLAENKVSENTINDFIGLLDDCEFARFAPSSFSKTMEDIYDKAVNVIGDVNSQLKIKK